MYLFASDSDVKKKSIGNSENYLNIINKYFHLFGKHTILYHKDITIF